MRLKATIITAFVFIAGCVSPHKDEVAVWAAISSDRPLYHRYIDEICITFSVLNDTQIPVRHDALRARTELIVNGTALSNPGGSFWAGSIPIETHLQPGETSVFCGQLTRYFTQPGVYRVQWKGEHFITEPIVFRVVDLTPGVITKTEAYHIADKASRENASIPEIVQPTIKETDNAFLFVYPRIDGKGAHGEDYYTKVTVDKKTGKITEFLKPR